MEEASQQQPVTTNPKISPLVYLLIIVVLVAGFLIFKNSKKDLIVDNAPSTNSSPSSVPAMGILLSDVESHNTREDCWTAIDGGVYDVTKFISKHKGGDKILFACGKDASDMFNGKAPMSRVHSEIAKKLLSGMKVGELQK